MKTYNKIVSPRVKKSTVSLKFTPFKLTVLFLNFLSFDEPFKR
jgi:hypothetical protein